MGPSFSGAQDAYIACNLLLQDIDLSAWGHHSGESIDPEMRSDFNSSLAGRSLGEDHGNHTQLWNNLHVLYTNVDGLPNKMDELLLRVEDEQPDIIVLTECIPKAQLRPLSLSCYTVGEEFSSYVNFDPEQPNLGLSGKRGVAILVKRRLNPAQLFFCNPFEEAIWIKIQLKGNDHLVLGVVYRSPSSDGHQSTDHLCKLMKDVHATKPTHLVIIGDFNFKEIDWNLCMSKAPDSHYTHKFVCTVQDCFLTQHVLAPTHHMPNKTPSNLDLVLSSEEDMISELKHSPPLGNSHHDCLSFKVRCYIELSHGNSRSRNVHKANFESMAHAVAESTITQDLYTLDVHSGWNTMANLLKTLEVQHAPLKNNYRKKRHPYSNNRLLRAKRKKDSLYAEYRQTGNLIAKLRFSKAKNDLRNLTRKLRRDYEADLVQSIKEKPKLFWKYIGRKMKTRARVEELKGADGSIAHTSKDKAEMLNEFFSNVFTKEDMTCVPQADFGFDGDTLTDIVITEVAVKEKLRNLNANKSPGPDRLHPRILKELAATLSIPLKVLFQKSLDTGDLPAAWREGEVVPIFKKGDRSHPGNYRPVSLTSIICKVMETLVCDAQLDHLFAASLLSDDQFGFLPKRSCALQLLVVIEEWMRIVDCRGALDVVYLDFKKAFDSVPHQRLISKLQAYGVGGKVLRWIEAFLRDRRQRVTVEGEHSGWVDVSSGIPQGSVLGPVLFLVFINDLPGVVRSSARLFADDTKMYRKVSSIQESGILQNDIRLLEEWSVNWQLPFNKEKCKLMHIGNCNLKFEYQMGEANITAVDKERDLGIIIDDGLKFHEQTAAAVCRANRVLGIIRHAFSTLDIKTLPMLFRTMVRPHLEYANSVWGPTHKMDQDAIEKVQRRATKLVRHLRNLPYEDRLRALKLPSMYYRRLRGDMIMVFQIMSGRLRVREEDLFERDNSERTRGHQMKLKKPRVKSHLRQTSFCCRIVPLWNGLPSEVVTAPSVNAFKNRLDFHWKNRWYSLRP